MASEPKISPEETRFEFSRGKSIEFTIKFFPISILSPLKRALIFGEQYHTGCSYKNYIPCRKKTNLFYILSRPFLEQDINNNPGRVSAFTKSEVTSLESLVSGVVVSDEEVLPEGLL